MLIFLGPLNCLNESITQNTCLSDFLQMGLCFMQHKAIKGETGGRDMDGEIKSLIKVWISAIISLCYCYFFVVRLPVGRFRLLFLLPILYLFIILPLNLSAAHFVGPTAFCLAWLANFKLILFSFGHGPLSSPSHPPKSLPHFISIACLPIKVKTDPSPISYPVSENSTDPLSEIVMKLPRPLLLAIKALLLAILIRIYDNKHHLHPNVVLLLYCCHMYLVLEIVLATAAIPARAIPGFELEPQFNEPYLATSLQDFWGRRWNLSVINILRPTVYDPVKSICTRILGTKWAPVPGVLVAFLVSGLMHESLYYYITRVSPTWEVTGFFVLQGLCTVSEVLVKKALGGRWQLHRAVSGPLTIGFVGVTAVWLFFPQLLRNHIDEKAIREYSILVDSVKHRLSTLAPPFMGHP